MKNVSFRKLLAGAALGLAVLGTSAAAVPVQAAGTATATIAADKNYQYKNSVSEWTYKVTVPNADTKVYYNIYKTDPADSETGRWYAQTFSYTPQDWEPTTTTTATGSTTTEKPSAAVIIGSKDYFEGSSLGYNSGKEQEVDVEASDFDAPGTYTIEFYAYNDKEYQEAYNKAYDEGAQAAAAKFDADYAAYKAGTTTVNPYDLGYAYYNKDENGNVDENSYGEYDAEKFMALVYKADYYNTVYTATFTVDVPEASVSSVVKSTSVQLNFAKTKLITGYEIYQKSGTKYTKIATTSSNTYTVKKLAKNTKYSFQIKPYYKDPDTGKKTYGTTSTYEATTIGNSLNAKYTLSGSNVKLSWSKVTGATEYNIYRLATTSSTDTVTKGEGNGYSAYEKIKTLKSTKTSYTDKTTVAGESYNYVVEAVLSDASGSSVTVSNSLYVSIDFGDFSIKTWVDNADGSDTVTWNTMAGADGYIVYQTNTVYSLVTPEANSDGYINYSTTSKVETAELKKLKKGTTSYTFPATPLSNLTDDQKEPEWDEYVDSDKYSITSNSEKVYVSEKNDDNITYNWDYSAKSYYYYKYTYTVNGVAYATYEEAKNARAAERNAEYLAYYNAYVSYKNSLTNNSSSYYIRAYKGSNLSTDSISDTTYPVLGVSAKVTATATTNGIKVSWSPIDGANYYQVYRVEAGALVKNADTGVYTLNSYYTRQLVYDYEGYTALQQVAATDDGSVRYYRNYSYKTSYITGTSVVDISGTISNGNFEYVTESVTYEKDSNGNTTSYKVLSNYVDKGAKKGDLYTTGLEAGVEYQYYVVGYYDPELAEKNYRNVNVSDPTANPYASDYDENGNRISRSYYGSYDYVAYAYDYVNQAYVKDAFGNYSFTYHYGYYDTTTHTIKYSDTPVYLHSVNKSDVSSYTSGAKKITSATFTGVKAPSAATIKSVKASGTIATITIKKAVKSATSGYKIYRSTKKNGTYELVGTISKSSKLTFKDKGLTKGKTYYYKVVTVTANEAGAEIEGKASAVKSVKIKAATKKK